MLCALLLPLTAGAETKTGECGANGDNLTWTLEGTALTITGTGAMADYTSSSPAPWGTGITSVSLPSGLTGIDDDAFTGCSALASIVYPGTISAWSAFSANIYVPRSATVQCSDGKTGFCGDSLTWTLKINALTITGTGAMKNYTSDSPAPWGTVVKSAVLANGVTSVGDYAFKGCTSLSSVTIPDSVTSFGQYAFEKCFLLPSIHIPADTVSIGNGAFENCLLITTVTVPGGVTNLGENAFKKCRCLTSVTIQPGVQTIGKEAFMQCNSLQSVTILASVTAIGQDAFTSGSSLSAVYYCGSQLSWNTLAENAGVPESALIGCDLKTGACGENMTWKTYSPLGTQNTVLVISGTGAMADYSSSSPAPWGTGVTSATLPAGITHIGAYAFYGCAALPDITIPDGVQSIGDYTFSNCTGLQAITLAEGLESIGAGAFQAAALTSVTIPNSVTSVGSGAFDRCGAARIAVIDSNGAKALGKAGYSFRPSEAAYDLRYRYNASGQLEHLEIARVDTTVTSITIPDYVTGIGDSAFENCASLPSITIPATVTSIHADAFKNCANLTYTFPCASCADQWATAQQIASGKITRVHVEADDAAVSPTCTATGLTAGKHCSRCNAILTAQQTVAALGHAEVTDAAVSPTCTATGLTEGKHCSRCNAVLTAQQTIAALGHVEVTDAAVAATCTTAGKTEGKHCSRCNAVLTAQQTVAALGHVEVTDAAVSPTCTATGLTAGKHCSRCNAILTAQQTVAALGHAEVTDAAVAATCTTAGKTEGKHCSRCNAVLTAQQTVAALGHNWGEATYVWNDSKTVVTASRVCKTDAAHTESEQATVTLQVTAPTNANAGEAKYTAAFQNKGFAAQTKTVAIHSLQGLNVLKLPTALQTIEAEAFAYLPCQAVIIPNGCTAIGQRAFANCQNLIYVQIPASVTSIAGDAFENCPNVIINRLTK